MTFHERASNGGLWLLLTVALATPAYAGIKVERIVDVDIPVVHQHPMCVTLAVTGVSQKKFGELEAPTKIYTQALRASILRSRVFTGVCEKRQVGLELSVVVFNGTYWEGKAEGMRLEGKVPVQWRLADPVTRRVLYQAQPTSTGLGVWRLGGAPRINAAYEAAMRASIVEGLTEISRLDLAAGP